jgi:hypothetical protein
MFFIIVDYFQTMYFLHKLVVIYFLLHIIPYLSIVLAAEETETQRLIVFLILALKKIINNESVDE